MVHESDLPEEDVSVDRLTKEAQLLLGAVSVSTVRTLHFIIFYLLSNSHMRERLEQELRGAKFGWSNDRPTWSQLKKLPYLQALIKEGLRHSYGTMHRLPRVSPDEALLYTDRRDGKVWKIPAGLFETDETDVVAEHDYVVPLARLDSKGVRVVFP
ncbi:hypothetical protein IQ06DRAFT_353534 [Phaeosphaeriaceae sp. SRC1lsM3a]|nr:hypothetical protein IQ06DRAFT_353534 [Stagonospora sp. SRC1lsM3a]